MWVCVVALQFAGRVGNYYNVISELNHQITMRLKLGKMWDHNGTYIDGLGLRYKDTKIVCELKGDTMTGEEPFHFFEAF